MIQYEVSNLLDVTSGIIVHGCNNLGIMSAGVALAIKNKYPECFDIYQSYYPHYESSKDIIQQILPFVSDTITTEQYSDPKRIIQIHPNLGDVIYWYNNELIIANAITQEDFSKKRDTDYNAIDLAFDNIFNHAIQSNIDKIHIPLIGTGIGGGSWSVIESIIFDRLTNYLNNPVSQLTVIVHCLTIDDIPTWRR